MSLKTLRESLRDRAFPAAAAVAEQHGFAAEPPVHLLLTRPTGRVSRSATYEGKPAAYLVAS